MRFTSILPVALGLLISQAWTLPVENEERGLFDVKEMGFNFVGKRLAAMMREVKAVASGSTCDMNAAKMPQCTFTSPTPGS